MLFFVFKKRPVIQLKMSEPKSFHVEDKGDELLSTIKVKVIRQRITVTRVNHRDFMINVAVERNVRNRRIFLSRGEGRRIKGPFFTFVAEIQRTAFMASGENDDKGSEHILAPRSVFVRLKKRSRASKIKIKKIMHHRLASNLTHRKCLICITRVEFSFDLRGRRQRAWSERVLVFQYQLHRDALKNSNCPSSKPCDMYHQERPYCSPRTELARKLPKALEASHHWHWLDRHT